LKTVKAFPAKGGFDSGRRVQRAAVRRWNSFSEARSFRYRGDAEAEEKVAAKRREHGFAGLGFN
jgi:hypothetical protein